MQPKLLIGMATYDDFDGVYFTIQSIRLHHPEAAALIEIAVVDNNPGSPHGQAVRDFLGWVRDVPTHYLPFTQVRGTAATRNLLFSLGTAPYVLVLDPHVLVAPGALARLIAYVDEHPDASDLLQGPMLYDDLRSYATHFDDRWDAEMWGKWSLAWRRPGEDEVYEPRLRDGHIELVKLAPYDGKAARTVPHDGREGLETVLERLGYRPAAATADEPPFDIPMMGLGLFGCRRGAWLGFNEKFRGFGGEEGYIHEKFRRAGRRCLCLPWLRWLHRFGRPGGVKYPLQLVDKVRNYVLGFQELGLDLAPIHDHFVKSGRVAESAWAAVVAGREMVEAPRGCCGQQAAPASLAEAYERAANTPSDINEHVPTLKELARQCAHVTEFGVRTGVSTAGLLAGQPQRLVSWDLNPSPQAQALQAVKGSTDYEFKIGDSTKIDIEETDFLFIDTRHTAAHLYTELSRHHGKVRRWIALHDTEIFGERGEDGGPGLLAGLRQFVREHPEWTVIRHDANNHGFTVLSRDPADKPSLPGLARQAWNFSLAMTRWLASGMKLAAEAEAERRLDICYLCPQRVENRCAKCGCYLVERPDGGPGKAMMAQEFCPLGKWHAVSGG